MASRRSLAVTNPNLKCLVRIYLLDGSSKVLQMMDSSTVADVLCQLKYNLDLSDISTCALFRVVDGVFGARRLELFENIQESMRDVHDTNNDSQKPMKDMIPGGKDNGEVRILFRTWINAKSSVFEKEVLQEHSKHKQPTSALWLAYMEAQFMCMTGRYYLSEDEALMLGCLRMQADSGDFNEEIHTLENIKYRAIHTFPRPLSTVMKALTSPTLAGSGKGDELARKIQYLYARVAGKHKAEAQIAFLQSLNTWCPFYGASYFTVQCQYDDGNEDEPPVSTINVAIGPLAIFLLTKTRRPDGGESISILRHPYKQIVKWVAYRDKHIFSYWTVKGHVSLRDIELAQREAQQAAAEEGREYNMEEDFDATMFCDCVYLVTPNCSELEYLVRAYVQLLKNDIYPRLRNATEELLPPDQPLWYDKALLKVDDNSDNDSDNEDGNGSVGSGASKKSGKDYRRRRRSKGGHFKQLFQALGGYQTDSSSNSQGSSPESGGSGDETHGNKRTPSSRDKKKKRSKSLWEKTIGMISGSGLGADSEDDEDSITMSAKRNGVEVAPNFFNGVYNDTPRIKGETARQRRSMVSGKSIADDDEAIVLPAEIQLAASISELQKLALSKFSDDEEEGEDTATSDDEGDSFAQIGGNNALNRKLDFGVMQGSPSSAKSDYHGGDEKEEKPPPPPGALRRMSNMLFGRGKLKVSSSGSGTSSGPDSSSDDYDSSSSSGSSTSSDDD